MGVKLPLNKAKYHRTKYKIELNLTVTTIKSRLKKPQESHVSKSCESILLFQRKFPSRVGPEGAMEDYNAAHSLHLILLDVIIIIFQYRP